MKIFYLSFILGFVFLATPGLSWAQNEDLSFLTSFPQCNDVDKDSNKGGVFHRNVADFVLWLDGEIYDGEEKAKDILAKYEITNFNKTVLIYVIGKAENFNYELTKKSSSLSADRAILEITFEVQKREPANDERVAQKGRFVRKNPLYLYMTDPERIKIKDQNGRRILKKVKFFVAGVEEPFSTVILE